MFLLSPVMMTQPTDFRCPNCQTMMMDRFCPHCGQKKFSPENFSLAHFFSETLKEFLSVDNRILHSLKPLLLQPGALTKLFVSGKQKQFVRPLSLFVFVNLFFFFVGYRMGLMNWHMLTMNGAAGHAMVTKKAMEKGIELSQYTAALDESLENYQRSLFFVVIPLYAVAMKVICIRKRRYFVEHLIYSIHYHSAYLFLLPVTSILIVLVMGIFDKIAGTSSAKYFGNDPAIGFYAFFLMVLYHFLAMKRLYADGIVVSIVYALLLGVASALIMIPLGQKMLFWLVWFTAS